MADIIRALTEAIDKVGLLAVIVICAIGVAAYTGWCYRVLVDKVIGIQGGQIKENTDAMKVNTASVNNLASYMSKFGSDPTKLCKAENLIRDAAEVANKRILDAADIASQKLLNAAESARIKLEHGGRSNG